MRSEKEKMLSGELYDPLDAQLSAERRRARLLFKALNDTRDDEQAERPDRDPRQAGTRFGDARSDACAFGSQHNGERL